MRDNRNLPAPVNPGSTDVATPAPGVPYYGYDEEEPAAGGSARLRRYLTGARRHAWLIVLVAVAGSGTAVFASRYIPRTYLAEATLWLEGSISGDDRRGPLGSPELLRSEAWVELMRSWTVLDFVVQQENLYLDYRARDRDLMSTFRVLPTGFRTGDFKVAVDDDGRHVELRAPGGIVVDRVRVGEALGGPLGYDWRPAPAALEPGREAQITLLTPREAARQLSRKLETPLARGGNFLRLQYKDHDPERAASIVNTTAERFVEVAAQLKKARTEQLREILQSQLAYAATTLSEAERSLEEFRVSTITEPSEVAMPIAPGLEATQVPALTSYFNLKVDREMLQRDAEAIRRIVGSSAADSLSVDALSAVGAVRQSPELTQALTELAAKRSAMRALNQQYTPEHRLVREAADAVEVLETHTVPVLARRLSQELDSRAQALEGLATRAGSELRRVPTRAIEEARLRRAVTTSEAMYLDLRNRYENARLTTETTVSDVRILDRATAPQMPLLDQRLQFILAGILASIALGFVIAVLLDLVDPRLRYVEQVTDELGLAVIGAVPSLNGVKRMKVLGHGRSPEKQQIVEALRSIRLAVMTAHGTAGPIMLTTTSPGSGDGKTFMTSNLALAFADLGMRTLVIDGDLRRGTLHRLFDVERRPGLTDYLAGSLPAGELVRGTRYPFVDLISGGTRRANSPELLSSSRMGELLARIRNEYQVILVDSPPLGAGIDPLILGTLTGNMVLVVRTGTTERSLAAEKIRLLDRLPVRLLGTIINSFDSKEQFRYYSYMSGYEGDEEEILAPPQLQKA
jgi:polysaccharide biosynthesis transport protein